MTLTYIATGYCSRPMEHPRFHSGLPLFRRSRDKVPLGVLKPSHRQRYKQLGCSFQESERWFYWPSSPLKKPKYPVAHEGLISEDEAIIIYHPRKWYHQPGASAGGRTEREASVRSYGLPSQISFRQLQILTAEVCCVTPWWHAAVTHTLST